MNEIVISIPETISESIKVKGKESTIIIRNRFDDGRSGNVIKHSTSIKVKTNTDMYSITVPTCSYYTVSTLDRATADLNNFRRSLKNKNIVNFVISFIYDNQAAIIAYWYVQNMSIQIKEAFAKYFSEQASANSARYIKGNIQPKIDKYLNADFDDVMNYIRKETGDPSFNVVFEQPNGSGVSGIATISQKKE